MILFTRGSVEYELSDRALHPSGAHLVSGSGELDLQAAPHLRDLLCRLIDAGKRDFVVDLTEATFLDSTAIGVLTGRLRWLRAHGGSLVLVCTNEHLLRTLGIAGMDRVFGIYSTVGEAVAWGGSR